eukprot:scaffold116_cov334-Pavlova_lutheri.AAC.58
MFRSRGATHPLSLSVPLCPPSLPLCPPSLPLCPASPSLSTLSLPHPLSLSVHPLPWTLFVHHSDPLGLAPSFQRSLTFAFSRSIAKMRSLSNVLPPRARLIGTRSLASSLFLHLCPSFGHTCINTKERMGEGDTGTTSIHT